MTITDLHKLVLWLYWIPTIIFLMWNITFFIVMYLDDKLHLAKHKEYLHKLSENKSANWHYAHYDPDLTIGKIIGYSLLSFIPLLNLLYVLLYILPGIIYNSFKLISRLLDIPVVRHKNDK